MSSDNNIVSLTHETNLNPASTQTATDTIIKSIKNCAGTRLDKLISQLFDNVENILSSENLLSEMMDNENKIRQNYIEEMQTFCLKKEQTNNILSIELLNHCDKSIKTSLQNKKTISIQEATNLLLSAQNEHIQESVINTNLITKAHKLYNEQLSAIEKRFTAILPNSSINKDNIPFGPEHLCRAFKKSLNMHNPSSELMLAIYSLFDKHVVLQLGEIYTEINSIMSDAGILPKLMSEPGAEPYSHFLDNENNATKNSSLEKTDEQKESKHEVEVDYKINPSKSNNDLFGTLQHLVMMKKNMVSINNRNMESNSSNKQHSILVESQLVKSKVKSDFSIEDLVDSLNELQQNELNNPELDNTRIIDYVVQKSYKQTQILSKKLKPTDESTIELICMLFDSIKQDANVPTNMKTAIARLKLPIIRVALSDKDFFNEPSHPSRVLINKLAFSSICWNEMNNINEDPLYKKVDYIINRIVNDAHHNVDIYSQLENELTHFLEKNTASKETVYHSPKVASNDIANNIAIREIEKFSSGVEVPEIIKDFLATAWKNVLSHIQSNIGESSLTWQYALSITSKLISSTQPKLTRKEKNILLIEIPIIVNGLQDGLTLISYNRTKMQHFLNHLELIHMASLKGELIDTYDLSSDETPFKADAHDQSTTLTPEMLIDEIDKITSRMDNKKNIVNNSESDAYLETVKKLTVGAWIEFTEANNKKFRVKLAWKSSVIGEYSFVDRNGNIVTEKTLSDLVTDFRNGHVHIINNSPLIDRTLDNVRMQLKNFVYKQHSFQSD